MRFSITISLQDVTTVLVSMEIVMKCINPSPVGSQKDLWEFSTSMQLTHPEEGDSSGFVSRNREDSLRNGHLCHGLGEITG